MIYGIDKDFQQLMEQAYGPLVPNGGEMTETEKLKAQIKVLEKKLSFLEELEKTKSPAEEAYKDWWGEYPKSIFNSDDVRWMGFQAGYNAAYEEKVAFREAVKQGVVSSENKSPTLYDLIADWWDEIFMNDNEAEVTIEDLVDQIQLWLPKEQSATGSQNAYVESAVEGFNDALKKIKGKLR